MQKIEHNHLATIHCVEGPRGDGRYSLLTEWLQLAVVRFLWPS